MAGNIQTRAAETGERSRASERPTVDEARTLRALLCEHTQRPGETSKLPRTEVIFFREDNGTVPLLSWLDTLPTKAQDKCRVRIERLKELGHELRRPEADLLRDASMSFE